MMTESNFYGLLLVVLGAISILAFQALDRRINPYGFPRFWQSGVVLAAVVVAVLVIVVFVAR